MSHPRFARLLRPYSWLELPGWGRLLRSAAVFDNARWRDGPTVHIRGKWHGYLMDLDLSNWSERQTYFLGRYYDLPTQLLLRSLLQPGDCFIDVGANIGMISLLAASLVGPEGRVLAIEPNPVAARRLRKTLESNGISWVVVHQVGLSDEPTTLCLSVFDDHAGSGTFAPVQSDAVTSQMHVEVVQGDDLLADIPRKPHVIKLDVEGYESRALRGLARTIRDARPIVLTEAVPELLERAGSNLDELFAIMRDAEYRGYWISTGRRRLRQVLVLRQVETLQLSANVVWFHQDEPRLSLRAVGVETG